VAELTEGGGQESADLGAGGRKEGSSAVGLELDGFAVAEQGLNSRGWRRRPGTAERGTCRGRLARCVLLAR
jgi:hypothetical protein